MLSKIFLIYGTAILIASGVSCLLALYSLNISFLNLDPPLSKQTDKFLGFSLFIKSNSEFIKPKIAEVSVPLELILGFFIKA